LGRRGWFLSIPPIEAAASAGSACCTSTGRSRLADLARWARRLEADSYGKDGGGLYARADLCHVRRRIERRGSGGCSQGTCTSSSIWGSTGALPVGRGKYQSAPPLGPSVSHSW